MNIIKKSGGLHITRVQQTRRKFDFYLWRGKAQIGQWSIIISSGEAETETLLIEREENRGKGYGKFFVLEVLKNVYVEFGVRKVTSKIARENVLLTEDFLAAKNLLLKMRYALIAEVKGMFIMELSGDNYRKLVEAGPLEVSRRELENIWQEEIARLK